MKPKNLDSELLREGFKSYHKALFAVMEFRREAGQIIQDAVENRVPELAAALKIDADELRQGICPYTWPDRLTQKEYDGSKADLGVRIPKDWNSKWLLYFYVWIGDDEEPYFAAQVTLKTPGSAVERLAAACKELKEELDYEKTYAYIWETVPPDGSRDLAGICDRVLNRWIALWKKVGGLQQFISKRG